MAVQPDLTDAEIAEAFQLIREHSTLDVHPLIDCFEKLLKIDRTEREMRRVGLVELNKLLERQAVDVRGAGRPW